MRLKAQEGRRGCNVELEQLKNEYLSNKHKIKELVDETNAERERTKKIKHDLEYKEYWSKIKALEAERDEKKYILSKSFDTFEETHKIEISRLSDTVSMVDRYIGYMKIASKFLPVADIQDDSVTKYDKYHKDEYLEWLGYLYNDEFLKIRLLIAENNRPKNKYSLMLYGRCVFSGLPDNIIEMPWSYGGVHLNDSSRYTFNIKGEVRCFPDVDELKSWVERNKQNILAEFRAQFEKIKIEYLEVTGKYTLDDFRDIIPVEKEQL